MRTLTRILGGGLTVLLTVGLLALGIGLIAGSGDLPLGAIAMAWGTWSVFLWFVARHGSDRLATVAFLLRPFATGTFLLALAAVIIAGRRSLDWVVILPLGLAWLALGAWLLWIYRRHLRGVAEADRTPQV